MAKAKSVKAKPGVFESIDALPTTAWGLARPPTGFGANATAHALLGLGYPHMLLTTDGAFTGTDEELRATMMETRIVPRDAVPRLYKLYAGDDVATVELAPAVTHLLELSGNYFATFALETLFGAVATATAFVDALEAYPTDDWSTTLDRSGGTALRGLAFVLWRAPTKTREALIRRLEGLHAKLVEAEAGSSATQALDVLLHGRAPIERAVRAGAPLFLAELLFAGGDPAWVRERTLARLGSLKAADREQFSIQLAVIGGPEVLAALRDSATKFPAFQKKSIALQLSLCA